MSPKNFTAAFTLPERLLQLVVIHQHGRLGKDAGSAGGASHADGVAQIHQRGNKIDFVLRRHARKDVGSRQHAFEGGEAPCGFLGVDQAGRRGRDAPAIFPRLLVLRLERLEGSAGDHQVDPRLQQEC